MKGVQLKQKMDNLWKAHKKDFDKAVKTADKFVRDGERYIKDKSEKGKDKLEIMVLTLQKEKLFVIPMITSPKQ